MVPQSKLNSWVEAFTNVLVGYVFAVSTQMLVFPLFGMHLRVHENLLIGVIFMGVSLVRTYVLRRVFQWYGLRKDLSVDE